MCLKHLHKPSPFIAELCHNGASSLRTLVTDFSATWNHDGTIDYRGISGAERCLRPGIPGRYQAENAAVALAAAEVLEAAGTTIPPAAYIDGIALASWPGRMELLPGTPPLLLDGAHNPAGAAALAAAVAEYNYSRLLMVTGVCNDKDFEQIYAPLLPLVDQIFTVSPAVERAMDAEELSQFFRAQGKESHSSPSVAAGITAARSCSRTGDLILVCGSLFLVGEVKALFEQVTYTGIRG